MTRIVRLAGPIAFAAANFVVLVILQQTASPAQFGLFGFMQIVIATGMGLINGVFGTPLALALNKSPSEDRLILGSFSVAWVAFVAAGIAFVTLVTSIAGATALALLLVATSALLMWLRWYVRSIAIATGVQRSATASDIVYGATSAATVSLMLATGPLSLERALAIQIVACVFSLLPAVPTLMSCIRSLRGARTGRFRDEFQRSGRWSTLMVVTTDIAANAHAYLITLFLGSAAFAPLALATLVFRPHGVILGGLIAFERPRMVANARSGSAGLIRSDVRFMHRVLLVTWTGNAAVAAFLLWFFSGHMLDSAYSSQSVTIALVLTSAIVLVRSFREPVVAALQAAGSAKPPAMYALLAAAVAAPLAVAIVVLIPEEPAWSLLGAVTGDVLFLALAVIALSRTDRWSKACGIDPQDAD